MNTLKEMVSDGKKVRFVRFKARELWYTTECGFEFPVPATPEEIGEATFLAEDKAMLFMRYIRKHIDTINSAKAVNAN